MFHMNTAWRSQQCGCLCDGVFHSLDSRYAKWIVNTLYNHRWRSTWDVDWDSRITQEIYLDSSDFLILLLRQNQQLDCRYPVRIDTHSPLSIITQYHNQQSFDLVFSQWLKHGELRTDWFLIMRHGLSQSDEGCDILYEKPESRAGSWCKANAVKFTILPGHSGGVFLLHCCSSAPILNLVSCGNFYLSNKREWWLLPYLSSINFPNTQAILEH